MIPPLAFSAFCLWKTPGNVVALAYSLDVDNYACGRAGSGAPWHQTFSCGRGCLWKMPGDIVPDRTQGGIQPFSRGIGSGAGGGPSRNPPAGDLRQKVVLKRAGDLLLALFGRGGGCSFSSCRLCVWRFFVLTDLRFFVLTELLFFALAVLRFFRLDKEGEAYYNFIDSLTGFRHGDREQKDIRPAGAGF